MRALFDISTLLALFDSAHVNHRAALTWWAENRDHGWASCPLTENGFLRIVSQQSYPGRVPLHDAIRTFQTQREKGGHEFWSDDISLVDGDQIDHTRLLGPAQITDIYLLALAVHHRGRLATLDRSIALASVRGTRPENLVIIG